MPRYDILVWGDVETFGLNAATDFILELGLRITDLNLNTLAHKEWLIWEEGIYDYRYKQLVKDAEAKEENALWVLDTHTHSNLFNDARSGQTPISAEREAIQWLAENHATGQPFCGSSVRLDRNMLDMQMPELNETFHYRIIDTSTLKELCRRYNKRVWEHVLGKNEEHRVKPDIEESIEEFRFYRDNFLFWS